MTMLQNLISKYSLHNQGVEEHNSADEFDYEDLKKFSRIIIDQDPDHYKLQNRSIWPAVRYILWCYVKSKKKFQNTIPFNFEVSRKYQEFYVSKCGGSPAHQLRQQSTDILVVQTVRPTRLIERPTKNSKSALKKGALVNGLELYHPILDPVIEHFAEKHSINKTILLGRNNLKPARNLFWGPDYIVPDLFLKVIDADFMAYIAPELAKAERVFKGEIDHDLFAKHLNQYVSSVNLWVAVLEAYRPKIVIFDTLGQHMALADAARRKDIPTVDVQHGVIRGATAVYNLWRHVPKDGWHGLPSHFICWTQEDAIHINEMFNESVKPIIAGLDMPSSLDSEEGCDEFHAWIKEHQLCVITLQEQTSFPKLFSEIIRKNSDILWLVFTHPKWGRKKLSNFPKSENVRLASSFKQPMPLGAVWKHTSAHLTRDSASIYDASHAGVPSYAVGVLGELAFSEEIARGEVGLLNKASDFVLETLPQPNQKHKKHGKNNKRLLSGAFRSISDIMA